MSEDNVYGAIQYKICKKSISSIKESSITLASILTYIDNNKLYTLGDYKNTAEFAKKEYDISKATVSRLLSIMRKFGRKISEEDQIKPLGLDDFDSLIATDPEGLFELKPEYSNYEYSKLAIMSQLDEDHLRLCKNELSVRQIQQILDAQKEKVKLEDKKKTLDNFDIKADPFWYDSKNVLKLYKIGKNQIRSPAHIKRLNDFLKSEDFEEYTEDQKISIFAVLAIKEKIERIGEKKNDT